MLWSQLSTPLQTKIEENAGCENANGSIRRDSCLILLIFAVKMNFDLYTPDLDYQTAEICHCLHTSLSTDLL